MLVVVVVVCGWLLFGVGWCCLLLFVVAWLLLLMLLVVRCPCLLFFDVVVCGCTLRLFDIGCLLLLLRWLLLSVGVCCCLLMFVAVWCWVLFVVVVVRWC